MTRLVVKGLKEAILGDREQSGQEACGITCSSVLVITVCKGFSSRIIT